MSYSSTLSVKHEALDGNSTLKTGGMQVDRTYTWGALASANDRKAPVKMREFRTAIIAAIERAIKKADASDEFGIYVNTSNTIMVKFEIKFNDSLTFSSEVSLPNTPDAHCVLFVGLLESQISKISSDNGLEVTHTLD